MKSAMAHLLLFLSLVSPAFAADIPVYPGAALDTALTAAMQEKYPDSAVYVTHDAFDKVDAFYRHAGTATPTGTMTKDVKHAGFVFPGKTFGASISWTQRSAATGTVITLAKPHH
jgi:hypothetical protein